MNYIITLLFFILMSTITVAQSDYRGGYVITHQNDTLHGYIDYSINARNITECKFKDQLNGKITHYTFDKVKAYRYYDANYFVALKIENQGTYFVEQLVDGIVDLFYFSDKDGSHYFVRMNDEIFELKNSKYEIEVNGKAYTRKKKEYINTLKYLFQDSPTSSNRIKNLYFDQNAFINLVEYYHNDVCHDQECIVYSKNKRFPKLRLGLMSGYTISNIVFTGNKYIKGLNSDFSRGRSLTYGLILNASDPYLSERFSLQIETVILNTNYFTDSTKININYLKIPFTLKYTFPVKKLNPVIQFGFAYNKWLDFKDEDMVPEIQQRDAIQKRRYQYGFLTGMEINFQLSEKTSLFIQGRYEYFGGKHWNYWVLSDRTGNKYPFQESVKSKSNHLSITTGIFF